MQSTKSPYRLWERLLHGVLCGVVLGIVASYTEYVLLFTQHAYFGNPDKAFWDIVSPYVLVGAVGGGCVALGLWLFRRPSQTWGQQFAGLGATLISLTVMMYLIIWSIYRFSLPLWKLSNLLAYLVSILAAIAVGMACYHVIRRGAERIERRPHTFYPWRLGLPVFTAIGIVIALAVPPLFLNPSYGLQAVNPNVKSAAMTASRPHVIVILIDTLRADHLPLYGYTRQTAPNLTALAQRGAIFRRMYAPAAATRPTVASLFSALYPAVHQTNNRRDFLPDSVATLAEVLREGGYRTFAVSANPNVSSVFGFSQGFDTFFQAKPESAFRMTMMGGIGADLLPKPWFDRLIGEQRQIISRAEHITDVALNWAEQYLVEPSFLYVHYLDPHAPYDPPAPFDEAFDYRLDPPRRKGGVDPLALASKHRAPEKVGSVIDRYDGEILYNDDHIGRLLEGLHQLGALENAIVIVTSDHGEEFWEHGQLGHSKTLYEEVLHVPFLMSWPGRITAGSEYREMAGLVDVLPTLTDMLDLPTPAGLQGMSFAKQLLDGIAANPERKFFGQLSNDRLSLEMVRHHRHKFIHYTRGPNQGREEFYDLERDPLERSDLATRATQQTSAWRQELEAFNELVRRADLMVEPQQVDRLDPQMIRALRSLGYLQ